jgi:hypothetical protein
MSTKTEGKHCAEFMISEAAGYRSRDAITVLSGQNLNAGAVLGRKLVSPTVGAAAALGTNTGNGTVSAPAVGANAAVQRGTYKVSFIEPAANLGAFVVYDPNGQYLGDGVVGTAFDNEITFTISDGATDFVSGDAFSIAVTGGTYKFKEYNPANTDGSQRPVGVLYDNVDASAADKAGVAIARDAEVRDADLSWFSGATSTQKQTAKDALAVLGIVAR